MVSVCLFSRDRLIYIVLCFLFFLARGIPIVSREWIYQCLEHNRWINCFPYLHPSSRLSVTADPFHDEFTVDPVESLKVFDPSSDIFYLG